jgi:penicillin-binding protein 1C
MFLMVIAGLIGVSVLLFQYYRIAATLPPVDDLRDKAAQFETTRILDRNGNILYEILDPTAGRRSYESLDNISPYLVAAIVATEDKGFYSHPGFDATAIGRAFLQNYQGGETVSGASTITQQLARMLLFSPEERSEITYMRKVREAILAAEITRRYTKDEILELYINDVYFGNLAYGVEAAAQTYFGTSADRLTLAQAAFLGGLIQAPSVYDVYTNRDVTLNRLEQVLFLMYEASQEQGCIYVSNSPQRICVDALIVADATNEMSAYEFNSPDIEIRYPHWVTYIRSLLETQFDAQTIYRSGFEVHTTLDPALQELAEQVVEKQVSALADRKASNGALVAIRPNTGEILAMVGSADFYNEEIDGQVNMAVSPRQPGSSIKPLTYIAAFEKGWTPATLIWDVPSEFPPSGDPNDTRPAYKPINYDDRFHGPVTVRSALANSYNVPAVKTLDYVGIYDNPDTPSEDGLIAFAKRLGITTLTRDDYGLSLTLGGGEVTLLDLTGAYAAIANGGRRVPPTAITQIVDFNGNVVYQYSPPTGDQVVRPEHAYLISSILSDNEARTPAFGPNSVLNLPFLAASKTGTTNDFRDNWTMGYIPELAVGVWVRNADYSPMQNISGLTGAAPIWAEYMQETANRITGGNPSQFIRTGGIVERIICAVSGTEPSNKCPIQRSELFAADQPPLPKNQDLWKKVLIDTWTGLESSPACEQFTDEKLAVNVEDPWAIRWLRRDSSGKAWAENNGFSTPLFFVPKRKCTAEDPRPLLQFTSPRDGDRITNTPLEIIAQAGATADFETYRLEYGLGDNPVKWELLKKHGRPQNESGKIYDWDLRELPAGDVTLRLFLNSIHETYAEIKMKLNMQVPTPTPTPTPTFTPTPTSTATPTFTITPTFTSTPTQTLTPTITPTFEDTPTPSPTSIDPFWTQPAPTTPP